MSQKPEESTHDALSLFYGQKLNYQFPIVNLESTKGFLNPQDDKLESTRERN